MLGLFCCFVVSVTITFGLVYCGRCDADFMLCFPIGLLCLVTVILLWFWVLPVGWGVGLLCCGVGCVMGLLVRGCFRLGMLVGFVRFVVCCFCFVWWFAFG